VRGRCCKGIADVSVHDGKREVGKWKRKWTSYVAQRKGGDAIRCMRWHKLIFNSSGSGVRTRDGVAPQGTEDGKVILLNLDIFILIWSI
jgi:hypothetical protein